MNTKDSLIKAKFIPNGPIAVEGVIELTLSDGRVEKVENPYLCRCGSSKNKPFCDGSHTKIEWKE